MRDTDLQRIEDEMAISLPEAYKKAMRNFPVRAYEGNADTALWNDPSAIIEFNIELRREVSGSAPWPDHMLAIGQAGDRCPYAIDLREPTAPVWWVDKCDLNSAGSGPTHRRFTDWVNEYVANTRAYLIGDGFDPDETAAQRIVNEERNARNGCRIFLAWMALCVMGVVLMYAMLYFASRR